ncbi:MAG: glycosyltransferase family A protein [Filomicrobium sp.]
MANGPQSISIIIPAYRRQENLDRALQSVQSQIDLDPRTSLEIIVVDDASPDPMTAGSYSASVRVVRLEENAGAGSARNAGLKASRGEYIAFLDSDDIWLPDKLARQVDLAMRVSSRRNADKSRMVIATGFYAANQLGGKLEARVPKEAGSLSEFVGGCWMCPGSTMFAHRSVFARTGGFDPRLRRLEDFDWMLRFAADGGQLRVARNAGVVIAPSIGVGLETVQEAVTVLRKKFESEVELGLSKTDAETLQSYLELKLARARLDSGWRVRGGYHLARSLLLKPRLTGSTTRYWDIDKTVPEDVMARYQTMTTSR